MPMCAAKRRSRVVTCNQTVKFADLLTRAQALGAACLATGSLYTL